MTRVAIIAGAAGGIGGACVRRFVAHGWEVGTIDRAVGQVEHATASRPGVDVGDADAFEDAVESLVEELGRPEAWIYAAGVYDTTPVHALEPAAWRALSAVNLDGQVYFARAALARRASGPTTLIGISSTAGLLARSGDEAYSATKAATVALLRAIGGRYAREDVLSVALCPGPVDTPLLQGAIRGAEDPAGALAALTSATALGRLIAPNEIAEIAYWLCDRRPLVLTASALPVDGGKSSVLPG